MLYRSKTARVFVAGELHGHAFRHGGPQEIAYGGAPKVVEDPAGQQSTM
jgi:hypothetical protein